MDSNLNIIDDFLCDFDSLRNHCDNLKYEGVTNNVDDVFYPGVDKNIPEKHRGNITDNLEALYENVVVNFMFLRLSLVGMVCPHASHSDVAMGEKSLMLYLNKSEDSIGGTALIRHVDSGMDVTPLNEKQWGTWEKDYSITKAWDTYEMASMLPNRAVIFNAGLMHRALPIGGFGNTPKNGRLVLTAFFDHD